MATAAIPAALMKLSIPARFLNGRSFRANTIVQRSLRATDGYAMLKQHVLVVANETLAVYYRARARAHPAASRRSFEIRPFPAMTTTYPNMQRRDGSVNSDITRGSVVRVN